MVKKVTKYNRGVRSQEIEKTSWKKIISSELFIVPFVSLLVYAISYFRLSAYLQYFSIPTSFIAIDFNNLAESSLILFFMVVSLSISCFSLVSFFLKTQRLGIREILTNYWPLFYILSIMVVIAAYCLIVYFPSVSMSGYRWLSAMLLPSIFTSLSISIISDSKRVTKGILQLIHKAGREFSSTPREFWRAYTIMLFVVAAFTFFAFIRTIGEADAKFMSKFYIAHTTPECIVLHQTSETAICAEFKRDTKELRGNYQVISYDGNPNIAFSYEEVGPLVTE